MIIRFLAFLLSLNLALPSPAFALRTRAGGLEEKTPAIEALQEALSDTAVGLEENNGRGTRLLKWSSVILALLGLSGTGYLLWNVPKVDQPVERVIPHPPHPDNAGEPVAKPTPSRAMESYFKALGELSAEGPAVMQFPFIVPTDHGHSRAFSEVKNRGGTVIGVATQFNFSLAVHTKPSLHVIYDINLLATEIAVPFFGYLMEGNSSRRQLLSYLLGVELTEQDVQNLLEPKPRPNVELRDYLKSALGEILSRVPMEDRIQWYDRQIRQILPREVLPRLQAIGRLNWRDRDDFLVDHLGGNTPFRLLEIPELTIRRLLHPVELLGENGPRYGRGAVGEFIGFLKEHARPSWYAERYGGWLSSEANYQSARKMWMEGRFVGMTADLTNPASIRRLADWLKDRKENVTVIYSSNVGGWVGDEKHRQMDLQFGDLPLLKDATILQSNDYMSYLLRPISHEMLRIFHLYVTAGATPTEQRFLYTEMVGGLRTPRTTDRAAFYEDLSEAVQTYIQKTHQGKIKRGEGELAVYARLIGHIRKNEAQVRDLEPEPFTDWAKNWAKQNGLDLPANTPHFRAFLWNLVDAGVIRPWSKAVPGTRETSTERSASPATGLEEEGMTFDRALVKILLYVQEKKKAGEWPVIEFFNGADPRTRSSLSGDAITVLEIREKLGGVLAVSANDRVRVEVVEEVLRITPAVRQSTGEASYSGEDLLWFFDESVAKTLIGEKWPSLHVGLAGQDEDGTGFFSLILFWGNDISDALGIFFHYRIGSPTVSLTLLNGGAQTKRDLSAGDPKEMQRAVREFSGKIAEGMRGKSPMSEEELAAGVYRVSQQLLDDLTGLEEVYDDSPEQAERQIEQRVGPVMKNYPNLRFQVVQIKDIGHPRWGREIWIWKKAHRLEAEHPDLVIRIQAHYGAERPSFSVSFRRYENSEPVLVAGRDTDKPAGILPLLSDLLTSDEVQPLLAQYNSAAGLEEPGGVGRSAAAQFIEALRRIGEEGGLLSLTAKDGLNFRQTDGGIGVFPEAMIRRIMALGPGEKIAPIPPTGKVNLTGMFLVDLAGLLPAAIPEGVEYVPLFRQDPAKAKEWIRTTLQGNRAVFILPDTADVSEWVPAAGIRNRTVAVVRISYARAEEMTDPRTLGWIIRIAELENDRIFRVNEVTTVGLEESGRYSVTVARGA